MEESLLPKTNFVSQIIKSDIFSDQECKKGKQLYLAFFSDWLSTMIIWHFLNKFYFFLELWVCDQCRNEFVDEESLKLHANIHNVSENSFTEAEIILRRELLYKEVTKQQDVEGRRAEVSNKVSYKPRRIYRPMCECKHNKLNYIFFILYQLQIFFKKRQLFTLHFRFLFYLLLFFM